jgi:hypothetical protein
MPDEIARKQLSGFASGQNAVVWTNIQHGRTMMKSVRFIILVSICLMFAAPVSAASNRGGPVKMFDADNDGTLDLAEVRKAASTLFAKLAAIMMERWMRAN